ncbi:hypothetical protein ACQZ46_02365 [Agrobacterium salinitolerans]
MSDIEQKCKVALQALSDWSATYAPDMCDPETVEKAKARILKHGTLWYVANATEQLHAAIQLLSEAETREREAKRIAVNAETYGYGHGLEAAAVLMDKIADKQKQAWDDHVASGSGNAATSHEAIYRSLASQLRSMQSEER